MRTWSAEQYHCPRDTKLLQDSTNGTCYSNSCDSNEVVTTRMADTGKCVHLAIYSQNTASHAVGVSSYPSGFEEVVGGYIPPMIGQEFSQGVMSTTGVANNGFLELVLGRCIQKATYYSSYFISG